MTNYCVLILLCVPCIFAATSLRIERLQDHLKELNAIIHRQRITLDRLQAKLDISDLNLKKLSNYNKDKRQIPKTTPVVGFTAAITKNKAHLTDKKTLIYETVLSNVHNGYNNSSGVFTCPVTGLYEFAASIISSGDRKRVDAQLVKNGVSLIHLSAHGLGYDTSSHVVITHCSRLQRVWVRHIATQHGSNQMIAVRPSYFSGHLIHAD